MVLLKKKEKEESIETISKRIVRVLSTLDDGPLYQKLSEESTNALNLLVGKHMEDENVFGYFVNKKDNMTQGYDTVICKIMLNFFGAFSSHTTPYVQKFLLTPEGINVLMELYPLLHKKGVSKRDLSLSFFEFYFRNLDQTYLADTSEVIFAYDKVKEYLCYHAKKNS